MENGAISDSQISASSEWNARYAVIYARLHLQASGSIAGAWVAGKSDANQWLQIDLIGQYRVITRVATQGRNNYDQWVTQYRLQYINCTLHFQDYREHGQEAAKVKYLT